MSCLAQRRAQAHNLANTLAACECVIGVNVVAPSVDTRAGWTVETTLRRDRGPAQILRIFDRFDAELIDATPRGKPRQLDITVFV